MFGGEILINGMGSPNFSDPTTFSPSNNIFWNETLFDIYSSFLIDTLLGLTQEAYPSYSIVIPPILPVNDTNRIGRSPTYILTSYQCSQLVWKGWVNALFSILVAVSSLWTGGYMIFLKWVDWIQE